MRLVKPSTEILNITLDPLALIEVAGRTCYKSEDKITPTSATAFAERILKLGHESVIEHASASVRFICDRGVTHEIVRHRLASYSQESTRYCDYNNGEVEFIVPPWCYNIEEGLYGLDWSESAGGMEGCEAMWINAMLMAEESYKDLRRQDWSPQQARSVLPNSLKTEIVMTANLREWRHFFKLRCAKAAHPQMREVAVPLLEAFKERIPVIFDDLVGFVES